MTVEKTIEQEDLMPKEREKTPKISRRSFLRGAAVVLGAAGASMIGLSLKDHQQARTARGELGNLGSTEEILAFLEKNYDVEIPNHVSPVYSEETYIRTSEGELKLHDTRENSLLNFEEAKIVAETISSIPAVGFLTQLIIPFRRSEEGVIPGGSYLGYQWPAYLQLKNYDEFPRDRFISNKAAIKLILPEGAKMTDALPVVREEYSNAVLPPLLQKSLDSAGVKANTRMETPWTTMGERLKQALVHETGHGLINQVTIAASRDMEDYWKRQSVTLYNMTTIDIDNPLFKGFAEVNGWKLIPFVELMRQYMPKKADSFADEHPERARKLFWERDLKIWGNLQDRKVRLTPYASYGPIQEAFCEYWMASILYPKLLTEEEGKFFETTQQGLQKNPAAFIQGLVNKK
jgi:hypothetical protein